ncbi:MAG: agmatinase [Candidatus Caldarchaeum sp.]
MSELDFLLRSWVTFFGCETPSENAEFFVFGVPYDLTSSFRAGSSQGPEAVRKFSANIEANSYRKFFDAAKAAVYDGGDIVVDIDIQVMLKRVAQLVAYVGRLNKIPVMLGGEHTFTYAAVKTLADKISSLIVFDAHFDLRDEYLGSKFNHACYLRRLVEEFPTLPVAVVGVRGYDLAEILFAEQNKVKYVKASELHDFSRVLRILSDVIDGGRPYVSVDIDVFDPAYAPGVGNPEPEGADPSTVFDLLHFVGRRRPVMFDVMEVNPMFDSGVTAALAAKVVMELIASYPER